MFATHGEEDEIYPLTIIEIAEAQKKDRILKIYYKRNAKHPRKEQVFNLLKTPKCFARKTKWSFQHLYSTGPAVGITTTSSTLSTHVSKRQRDSVTNWRSMQHTIQSYNKSCRSCQVNKRHSISASMFHKSWS